METKKEDYFLSFCRRQYCTKQNLLLIGWGMYGDFAEAENAGWSLYQFMAKQGLDNCFCGKANHKSYELLLASLQTLGRLSFSVIK